jgi:hypothetical protein
MSQLAAQWLVALTGGPWAICDQTETARTLLLRDSCLVAAWRSAVLDDASMVGVYLQGRQEIIGGEERGGGGMEAAESELDRAIGIRLGGQRVIPPEKRRWLHSREAREGAWTLFDIGRCDPAPIRQSLRSSEAANNFVA